ncbi:MAG: hypothetical protein Q8S18_03510 [Bacteroidales bacterium]|nr:hypothetical protein [Bacteroidales bacterium]
MMLLLVFSMGSSGSWLADARDAFFQFGESKCRSEKLYDYLIGVQTTDTALYLAYKGMSRASSADCSFNPSTKLNRFRQGRNWLEEAIKMNPDHPEIRLMRLSVQLNAPFFLDYSANIADDRNQLIELLVNDPGAFKDDDYTLKVLNFVEQSARPTDAEMKQIKGLINYLQKNGK